MTIELAQTTDNDTWAVPEGYCYACGFRHINGHADYSQSPPEPATAVLGGLVYGTIPDELGLPDAIDHWHPAHVEALRALVADLQHRIDIAERCAARAARAARNG